MATTSPGQGCLSPISSFNLSDIPIIGVLLLLLETLVSRNSEKTTLLNNRFSNLPVGNIRVLALNVWGMPAVIGSMDKELRMKVSFNIMSQPFPSLWPSCRLKFKTPKAIGDFIAKAEYDIYMLVELWMRPDHATIQAKVPEVSSLEQFVFCKYKTIQLPLTM